MSHPQPPTHFSSLLLGAGQASSPLALSLAAPNTPTLLIESTQLGGTCINTGCTPTKTLIASAHVAHTAVRAAEYGINFKRSSLSLDWGVVQGRRKGVVEEFRGGSERRVMGKEKEEKGLWVWKGKGRFVGEREVEVEILEDGGGVRKGEVKRVTAEKVFVNVGCRPGGLEGVRNADKVRVLDSTSVIELGEVPRHLILVGGGYIGVEMAQLWRRFGARVSLVQRGGRLLPREDEDVSEAVKEILVGEGIDIYTDAETREISNVPTGQVVLQLGLPDGGVKTLMGSYVLAAAGRTPNTQNLGLDKAGVEVDKRGFIMTNEELETTADGVYAMGDVISGHPQFTHISYDDSRILKHNLITNKNSKPRTTTDRLVPYTMFMDPQLGRVGHNVTSARKAFPDRKLGVAKMPMSYVARAIELAETQGFMKAVVDMESKEILGFTCLGIEGGELATMMQIAMMGKLRYTDLEGAVFAHPTLAESLNNLWGMMEELS